MSLPQFSIRKKVTVIMLTMGLIVVGVISFLRLPQELFPQITFPQVTVVTDYANAAPEEIETLITKPIEEAIGSVSGLRRIESISREGRSTVIVSFNWGQNIDFAALAVREKIDLIKERLPKESEDPVVLKFDPLSRPIMILSVTGPDLEPVNLKYLAEKIIKDNLEKLDGVASVSISGGVDREILVEVDQARLEANHLSLLGVIESIENSNVTYPAGSIKKGLYEYLIRTVGEFRNVKEIAYTVAGTDTVKEIEREEDSFVERGPEGPRDTVDKLRSEVKRQLLEKRLVLVKDIAEVIDGTAERTSMSRHNGKENLSLSIQKQANANTVQLVDRLKEALKFLNEDISTRGLRYEIIYDHSFFIRRSLASLMDDAKMGGFLAFVVLLLFLRSAGPAIIIILTVPISMLGTFFLLNLKGITLNTMSISGLVLAIGMITDTSIVVLENIFRRRQMGEERVQGAVLGTEEVTWPVITSNLTTIAVFFPLIVFVPGIPGQIFKDLSWAIIFTQVISTILPLTLVVLLSIYVTVKAGGYKPWNWTGFLEKNLLSASRTASQRLRYAASVLGIVFLICSSGFFILPTLEREVLPKVDQGQFLIKVDMPIGTRLEITDQVCGRIEALVRDIRDIKDIAVTVGSEKTEKGQIKVETLRAYQGILTVVMHPKRKRSSADVVRYVQEQMKKLEVTDPDIRKSKIDFLLQESEFAFAEGGVKPIPIEISAYKLEDMQKIADEIKEGLAEIRGVIQIQDDRGESAEETKLEIDKRRAALYGISALDVSLIAKAALEGVVATQYREAGKEHDIRVRLKEADRKNPEHLGNLLLYSHVLDDLIPLKDVATVTKGVGPSEVKRVNQERTITVSADIDKHFSSKKVLDRVQKLLRVINPLAAKLGAKVTLSGKAKEVKENFTMVLFAFILAVALVYMIMASLFESFTQPFIIMLTVPLALFGVIFSLWLTGHSLSVISLLGAVLLAGTAVANGIVLIEYINQAREGGMEIEAAAIEAVKIRTRPILMSALTSVMGLVPLALGLGEGAELRSPMAVAIIGGTLTSTFLTLVVLPCFYILAIRLSERFFGEEEEEIGEKPEGMIEKV